MLLMQAAEFKADRKMFNAKAKKWTLQHAEGGLGGGGLNAADNTVGGSSAAASGGGGGGNGSVGGHADGNRKPPMGTASVQTVREFSDCFFAVENILLLLLTPPGVYYYYYFNQVRIFIYGIEVSRLLGFDLLREYNCVFRFSVSFYRNNIVGVDSSVMCVLAEAVQ